MRKIHIVGDWMSKELDFEKRYCLVPDPFTACTWYNKKRFAPI
jgi:hypothetical protein